MRSHFANGANYEVFTGSLGREKGAKYVHKNPINDCSLETQAHIHKHIYAPSRLD
jgi:hypothetical protein